MLEANMYARFFGLTGLLVALGCGGESSLGERDALSNAGADQEQAGAEQHPEATGGGASAAGASDGRAGAAEEAQTGGNATGGASASEAAGSAGEPVAATGGTTVVVPETGGALPTGGSRATGGSAPTGGRSHTGGAAGGESEAAGSSSAAGSSGSAGSQQDGASGSSGNAGEEAPGGAPPVPTKQLTIRLECSDANQIASSSWGELTKQTHVSAFGLCRVDSATWIPDSGWPGSSYNYCTKDNSWDGSDTWAEPASDVECDSNTLMAKCCGMDGVVEFVVTLVDPTFAK